MLSNMIWLIFFCVCAQAFNITRVHPTFNDYQESIQKYNRERKRETKPISQVLIVGGHEVALGSSPYVVGLRESPESENVCGGTLIAPNYVLTAAHCVAYTNKVKYVSIGSHFNQGTYDGEQIAIRTITEDTLFNNELMLEHDYAILELSQPSTYSPILLLANDDVLFDKSEEAHIAVRGWGHTHFGGQTSTALQMLSLPTVDNEECEALLGDALHPTMLCAGGAFTNGDACQNDSGGPLTFEISGTIAIAGIVSWGHGCNRAIPGVYARVSKAYDFINNSTEGHQWIHL